MDLIPNPNNSDLEDIDITDEDSENELQHGADSVVLEESDSSDADGDSGDEDIPLITFAGPNTLLKYARQHRVWFSEKDNEHSHQSPPFLGQNDINIDGDTPYFFLCKFFQKKRLK